MMEKLVQSIREVHRNDHGAMSIEKVLLILVIVIPIIIALVTFRKELMSLFEGKSKKVLKEAR